MKGWVSTVSVAVVLLLALGLVAGSYVQAKRTLAAKTDDLNRAYEVVAGAEQHRLALLPQLMAAIHAQTPAERTALTVLEEDQATAAAAGSDHAASIAANRRLDEAVTAVLRVEDARPEQRSNQDFQDVASEVVTAEKDLSLYRRRYDRTVADYNIYLGQFPNNLWGHLAGYGQRNDSFDPTYTARTSEFAR